MAIFIGSGFSGDLFKASLKPKTKNQVTLTQAAIAFMLDPR